MDKKLYYDKKYNEYILCSDNNIFSNVYKKDRYYKIIPSNDNIYKEKWYTNKDTVLEIIYNNDMKNDIDYLRIKEFIKYSVRLKYMISLELPKNIYDDILDDLRHKSYLNIPNKISLKTINLNRLNDFSTFEENWDDYNASKINKYIIYHAEKLINNIDHDLQPEIFPMKNGSIQFEWGEEDKDSNIYLELELLGDYNFNLYYLFNDGMDVKEANFNITIAKNYINDFIRLVLDKKLIYY